MYKKENLIYTTLRKCNKYLEKNLLRKIIISSILIIVILIIASSFQKLFFTVFLILLGILSFLHNRFFRLSHTIGFELCTFATVLTGVAYGPGIGALTGAVSITGGMIVGGYFKHSSFISIITLPLMGVLAYYFRDLPITTLGVAITILYDAIIIPFYILLGSRISKSIVFIITHIFINFWIFSTVAPFMLNIM